MSRVYETRSATPDHKQPTAARVAKYLRERRDSGLPTGATLDQIGTALRMTDRQAIREALELLTANGKVTVDHGPRDLGSQRQPDKWSAT
ncbi:hypothetical protein [Streptomyces sp. GESEQ-35]|uniref:hypothetical protein n=1 Tax=Streptomyces sp. GESEQ-35 TaxID=2812657 RepID=UPI001B332D68|nr:hypothetical protein [Streptomyces sp. GESEQ-35]